MPTEIKIQRIFIHLYIPIPRFSQHTLAEWLIQFEGSSCPYGPINNMEEVFSDPQVSIEQRGTNIQNSH